MGYDLIGRQGRRLSMDVHGWRLCLDAARMYGWKPEGTWASTWGTWRADGTFTPDWTEEMARNWAEQYREDKYSSYFSNNWQEVTEADARALAVALDRAVAELQGDGAAGTLMRIRAAGASAASKLGHLLSVVGDNMAEEMGVPASELRFQSQREPEGDATAGRLRAHERLHPHVTLRLAWQYECDGCRAGQRWCRPDLRFGG